MVQISPPQFSVQISQIFDTSYFIKAEALKEQIETIDLISKRNFSELCL